MIKHIEKMVEVERQVAARLSNLPPLIRQAVEALGYKVGSSLPTMRKALDYPGIRDEEKLRIEHAMLEVEQLQKL